MTLRTTRRTLAAPNQSTPICPPPSAGCHPALINQPVPYLFPVPPPIQAPPPPFHPIPPPQAFPPINRNGANVDEDDDEIGGQLGFKEAGYGVTFKEEREKSETFYITYFATSNLPHPESIHRSMADSNKVIFYFDQLEEYEKVIRHPFPRELGFVDHPPGYDPKKVGFFFYKTHFAGDGIEDPDIKQRITRHLEKEGIKVTNVHPSKSKEYLAVYTADMANLGLLVSRKVDKGLLVIRDLGRPARFFHNKQMLTCSNDPSINKIKVEGIPSNIDDRLIDVLKLYAWRREAIPMEDILFFVQITKRNSTAGTPFGYLFVRGDVANEYFLKRATPTIKRVPIRFAVPEVYAPAQQN